MILHIIGRPTGEHMEEAAFHQALKAHEAAYRNTLPARVAAIEQGWSWVQRNGQDAERIGDLVRAADSLARSAALFGFVTASYEARILAYALKSFIQGVAPTDAAAVAQVRAALDGLRRELDERSGQ